MIETTILEKLSSLQKKVSRKSKVLNITHNDLDGVGCRIVLGNSFDNVAFVKTSYGDINPLLEGINYNNYDLVIITDISPEDNAGLLDISDKIILLDHHDTAIKYHNPSKHRFIDNTHCATTLVKMFCELVLDINLSYLNDLVYLINDYDLWIHEDPRSKKMNLLYYKYWDQKLYQRFFQGHIEFNAEEEEYFDIKDRELKKTWDDLMIYEMGNINGAICSCNRFINDIAVMVLDDGYDIVFVRNPQTENISVRIKRDDFHVGDFLEELGIGGGHAKAGGITKTNADIADTLQMIEREIGKNYRLD